VTYPPAFGRQAAAREQRNTSRKKANQWHDELRARWPSSPGRRGDRGAVTRYGAIAAADTAFPEWSATSSSERAERVRRIADVLEENDEELALLDAVDSGAPILLVASDIRMAASMIRYYAGLVLEQKGYSSPSSENVHFTTRQPYGVVARITPFNHPILFAAWKLAIPLVAGNCVVLKSADATPLSALYLGHIIKDILPPGMVSILVGEGPSVPRAIVRHSSIRSIATRSLPLVTWFERGGQVAAAAARSVSEHDVSHRWPVVGSWPAEDGLPGAESERPCDPELAGRKRPLGGVETVARCDR